MSDHDVIVIGASAGGIEALNQLVARLPADFQAAIFVVVHVPAHSTSVLPRIFNRAGPLRAEHASLNEPIHPGRIYVAPPDRHMIIRPGRVLLTRGPKENGHRPSVDPLFRSAALAYGPRVIGVILSGSLDDGSAGLAAVKQRGGLTVVQSPDEALYPSMPRSAMLGVEVDHVVSVAAMADLFVSLSGRSTPEVSTMSDDPDLETEVKFDELDPGAMHDGRHPGTPSGFGCPDCGGSLWELSEGVPIRFRCRVGHAWTAGSLLAEQAGAMESALWTALRTLEERASLCRKMSGRLKDVGSAISAGRLQAQSEECLRSAEVIRRLIATGIPAEMFEPSPADAARAGAPSGLTPSEDGQDMPLA